MPETADIQYLEVQTEASNEEGDVTASITLEAWGQPSGDSEDEDEGGVELGRSEWPSELSGAENSIGRMANE